MKSMQHDIVLRESKLQKHANTGIHKKLVNREKNPTIEKFINSAACSKDQIHEKKKVKEGEIKPATLLAEHNVAFQMVDHLLLLMKSVAPDPKILKDMQMKTRKCIFIEENVFAEAETVKILSEIKKTFSLLMDESTDISTNFLCVLIRYVPLIQALLKEAF